MYGVAGVPGVSAPRFIGSGSGVERRLALCEGAAESLKGEGPLKSSRDPEAMGVGGQAWTEGVGAAGAREEDSVVAACRTEKQTERGASACRRER